MEAKTKYHITLYLDQAELDKLKEVSVTQKRKLANTVTWLLRRALDELQY